MLPVLKRLESSTQKIKSKVTLKSIKEVSSVELLNSSCVDNDTPSWAFLTLDKIDHCCPEFSLIIFRDNQIIGWLLTFPLGNEILDYRTLWISPKYRNTGISLYALSTVIRCAHFRSHYKLISEAGEPWGKGHFQVNSLNEIMMNFSDKHLAAGVDVRTKLTHQAKIL